MRVCVCVCCMAGAVALGLGSQGSDSTFFSALFTQAAHKLSCFQYKHRCTHEKKATDTNMQLATPQDTQASLTSIGMAFSRMLNSSNPVYVLLRVLVKRSTLTAR